jgi:fatty-acyl-CoA synthase
LLSFVHGASSTPLLFATVDGVLRRAVATGADRTALVVSHQSARYTFRELDEAVERVARGFVACGLKPGERVGIWSPNRSEWVLTMFGAARAGLILVNINPAYRTYELEYTLRLVACRALVFAPAFRSSDYLAMLRELLPELSDAQPA